MTIFWPGLIIGVLIIAACIFGFKKADFISRNIGTSPREAFGGEKREKTDDEIRKNKGYLMLPIFGGMIIGLIFILGSIFGAFNY